MLNVCVSMLAAALLQATPPQPANTHPDLTGTWTLNREQSTPAGAARGPQGGHEGGEGSHQRGMGGGGGHHGGMGGMGGGGGRGGETGEGGGRNPEQMAQQRAVMQEILEPRPKFTIVAHDEKITFAEPDGWTRTYEANGDAQKHQEMSGTIETKSRWNGEKLEIEMKASNGMTVTRTYEISGSAPRQLIVTTKMSGGREGGDRQPIKWVYDEATDTE
jgi:hypothetical protein